MAEEYSNCPHCGKPFSKYSKTGLCGFCTIHHWIPRDSGRLEAVQEASRLNVNFRSCHECHKDYVEYSKSQACGRCPDHGWVAIDEDDRDAVIEATRLNRKEKKTTKYVILLLAVLVLAIAAAAVYWTQIRPSGIYDQAMELMKEKNYSQASKTLAGIKGYKDSGKRILFCDAAAAWQEGDPEKTLEALGSLKAEAPELSGELEAEVSDYLSEWEENGISPDMFLRLLEKAAKAGLESLPHQKELAVEAHRQLLPEKYLQTSLRDLDGDGEEEFLCLTEDYSVKAYKLLPEKNEEMTVDAGTSDRVLAEFIENTAVEQAKQGNQNCVQSFQIALSLGADLSEELPAAAAAFPEGKTRIDLLCLQAFASGEASPEQEQALAGELEEVLSNWKELKISPEDVTALCQYAGKIAPQLEGTDQVLRDAVLSMAERDIEVCDAAFFVPEGGEEALLVLGPEGMAALYAGKPEEESGVWIDETISSVLEPLTRYTMVWAQDTGLSGGKLTVCKNTAVVTGENSGMALKVYSFSEDTGRLLLEEAGIQDIHIEEDLLTYRKPLEGSIERTMGYAFSLETPGVPPTETDIGWPQKDYPYPETPEALVQRFFEAWGYGIEEERQLLLGSGEGAPEGFSLADLDALPPVRDPFSVECARYDQSEAVLLEAVYQTRKDQKEILYVAVSGEEPLVISGFSHCFAPGMEGAEMVADIPLLCPNQALTGHLEDRNDRDVYRILLSRNALVHLYWKAGEKKGDKAFNVSLAAADALNSPVFSRDLELSLSTQESQPLFLRAGVYYLQVLPVHYRDCDYQILLELKRDAALEIEDNNIPEKAQKIELHQAYTGSLFEKKDVDYFRVTLPEPGNLIVQLEAAASSSKSSRYVIGVYAADGETLLTRTEMLSSEEKVSTGNLFLASGEYLIQISKGSTFYDQEYHVTARYEATQDTEQEINDTAGAANAISIDTTVGGCFGREGDVDYFRFETAEDYIIQPKLTFRPLETSVKTYVITLYKEKNLSEKIYSMNIQGKEPGKLSTPLPIRAGAYIVKVENPSFSRQDYQLSFNRMEVEMAEQEPDDTPGFALDLAGGPPVSGVLAGKDDVDIYKLSLAEESIVTISFTFQKTNSSSDVYALKLEHNGKSVWKERISADSGGLTRKLQAPAGEYYLYVEPVTWLGAVYEISAGLEKVS